jgi:hypothetical protein
LAAVPAHMASRYFCTHPPPRFFCTHPPPDSRRVRRIHFQLLFFRSPITSVLEGRQTSHSFLLSPTAPSHSFLLSPTAPTWKNGELKSSPSSWFVEDEFGCSAKGLCRDSDSVFLPLSPLQVPALPRPFTGFACEELGRALCHVLAAGSKGKLTESFSATSNSNRFNKGTSLYRVRDTNNKLIRDVSGAIGPIIYQNDSVHKIAPPIHHFQPNDYPTYHLRSINMFTFV